MIPPKPLDALIERLRERCFDHRCSRLREEAADALVHLSAGATPAAQDTKPVIAALDELLADKDSGDWTFEQSCRVFIRLHGESLRDQLVAAERDGERLDFIVEQGCYFAHATDGEGCWLVWPVEEEEVHPRVQRGMFDSGRAAVDAARGAGDETDQH